MLTKKTSKRNVTKKAKTKQKRNYNIIPYLNIYKEINVFEVEKGLFSKTYSLKDINHLKAREMETVEFFIKFNETLHALTKDVVDAEITFYNKNQKFNKSLKADYMLNKKDNNSNLNNLLIDEYNKNINDLLDKKTINIVREKYLTLTIKALNINEAEKIFIENEKILKMSINNIADADITIVPTKERLRFLYEVYNYNDDMTDFNNMYEEMNNLDSKIMSKKKLISKDLCYPKLWNMIDDVVELDKGFFRSLFLSDIPPKLNSNLLSDISNMNIPMLISIHVSPIDPENALKNLKVAEGKMHKQNEVKKKKNKYKTKYSKIHKHTEEEVEEGEIIEDKLLSTVKNELEKSKEKNQLMFFNSIYLTHFNTDLKALDIDTSLIKDYIKKYESKFNICTFKQKEGLHSSLPIGVNKLKTSKVLDSYLTSYFTPFTPGEVLRIDGICYGINSINDDLVFLNRSNSKFPSGFIITNDKQTQLKEMKKEILLNQMANNDKVIILSSSDGYDNFVKKIDGQIIENPELNVFDTNKGYSDVESPEVLKYKYLIALFTSLNNGGITKEQKNNLGEIMKFIKEQDFNICVEDIKNNFTDDKYKYIIKLLNRLPKNFCFNTNLDYQNKDITLLKYDNNINQLVLLDYIWNRVCINGQLSLKTWIYIDNIELLFKYKATSIYFNNLFNRVQFWSSIFTLAPNNFSNLIITSNNSLVAMKMIQNSNYKKLINISINERNKLLQYITVNQGLVSNLGYNQKNAGVILTQNVDFAYNDFIYKDSHIYKLINDIE